MLQLRGITKSFGGIRALRDVDFSLAESQIHALVGENGAGKSTLIKVISGLHAPDSGTIELEGSRIRIGSASEAQQLGIQTVHQELELADALTVAENIYLGRLPRTAWGLVDYAAMERGAAQELQALGARIDPRTRVGDLTIGDRQIVEIARAIHRRARILIMDEPTAALPPQEVKRLFEVLSRLVKTRTSIVYISHRLDEVLEIADQITVLRDGRNVTSVPRESVDRKALVRHILGRDLHELSHVPSGSAGNGEVAMSCRELACAPELKDLSFELRSGEVLGFFGLLGAGQSSIAAALFGLRDAACREYRVGGRSGLPSNPREALAYGVGYVPADRKGTGLALNLSIKENLMMTNITRYSRFGVLEEAKIRERSRQLVGEYAIRCADVDQKVQELSGGNQQKISVAKWVNRDMRILFFDEPTRGVDIGSRVEIYKFIQRFAESGWAVLVSSSDAAEIGNLCSRVIVLKDGKRSAEFGRGQISETNLIEAAL